jgi:hypothetical protein
MKHTFVTILLTAVFLSSFSVLAVAQNANEKVIKRTEKVRKDVSKVGTGEKTNVEVDLIDGKVYAGYISEANDKTFVVIDKKNQSNTIDYSDVRKLYDKKTGKTAMYIMIGVGAAALTFLLIFWRTYCNNEGC